MSTENTKPVTNARVYDKHAPEGEQDVAHLVADAANGRVCFVCQHTPEGVNFLSKQHAVEFATSLLMLALGLPGDIPAGEVGHVDGPLLG